MSDVLGVLVLVVLPGSLSVCLFWCVATGRTRTRLVRRLVMLGLLYLVCAYAVGFWFGCGVRNIIRHTINGPSAGDPLPLAGVSDDDVAERAVP